MDSSSESSQQIPPGGVDEEQTTTKVPEESIIKSKDAPDVFEPNHPMYVTLSQAHIIRLVEVLPGAPESRVIVRLSIHELEHAPQYDAISYVWGDEKNRTDIECNGKKLSITVSLDAAFRRVRLQDLSRLVWADAICINQKNNEERSHHVAFMNSIYKHAAKVLVCMGNDSDGGANDVAALIEEYVERKSGHKLIADMPVLPADDPIFKDKRWKSLATLMRSSWFKRAWVLQEVGVAADPRVLYGAVEFGYRHLMQLSRWITRCAQHLTQNPGIYLQTIHTDWEDWSENWREGSTENYSLLDFLSHAKSQACRMPQDHIYAFIGHPLAQKEDGSGLVIAPDYEKPVTKVYRELTEWMLAEIGLGVLSAVEHTDQTISEDVPSWAVRWNMDIIWNSMGYYSKFCYRASGPDCSERPPPIEGDRLKVQGISLDIVRCVYQFSEEEEDWPCGEASTDLQTSSKLNSVLDRILSEILRNETACIYPLEQRLNAFSLTMGAGLRNYACAEADIKNYHANINAFWQVRQEVVSQGTSMLPAGFERRSEQLQGDADEFWFDVCLSCKGRSFFVTEKGYYGLGPLIAKPGDECHIIRGARVPFVLRKALDEDSYKVVGEAYIYSIMHGELIEEPDGNKEWSDLTLT